MRRSTIAIAGVLAILAVGLTGCQQPKLDPDKIFAQRTRPAELDQLNPFIGTWEGTWQMTMSGAEKPLTGKGTDNYMWDAEKWVMLARGGGMMGNNKMAGTGLWTWDAGAKLFRYTSADNYGMLMTGTMRYDAKTSTWKMKGSTIDTLERHKSVGEGTMKMPDPNTMEWSWTEWDSLHLSKFMEMKGTSRRR